MSIWLWTLRSTVFWNVQRNWKLREALHVLHVVCGSLQSDES